MRSAESALITRALSTFFTRISESPVRVKGLFTAESASVTPALDKSLMLVSQLTVRK